MSDRRLYSLSEREAAVLRARDPRWTDSAQRATPDPLTPIDTDAAVERMARATYGPKAWDALDPSDPMGAAHRSAHKAQMRTAFDALLEGDA